MPINDFDIPIEKRKYKLIVSDEDPAIISENMSNFTKKFLEFS